MVFHLFSLSSGKYCHHWSPRAWKRCLSYRHLKNVLKSISVSYLNSLRLFQFVQPNYTATELN